jgi:hypothetical protein
MVLSRCAARTAACRSFRFGDRPIGRGGQQVLQRSEQQRQRGPQLVAHVLEELHLGLVQIGQHLAAQLLHLVGQGVIERDPHLPGDQREEPSVMVVQRPVGVHPDPQHADRRGPSGDRQRQQHRLIRGLRPQRFGQQRTRERLP